MSSRFRVAMGGVSEPIGESLIELARHQPQVRLVALTLGEIEVPHGSRMEVFIADADRWSRVMRAMKLKVFVVGLGPALNLVGKDDSALRAIDDEETVVEIAKTARFAGVERLIAISSEGADRWSRDRHLSAKGKAETELSRLGFKRLDIVRPGPLSQSGGKRRISALRGRGTDVDTVAKALMTLSLRRTPGKFTHDEEGIERAAAMLSRAPAAKDGAQQHAQEG
ncbi:MAG TPA: nucleoside-diphosphate sugar epimerase [Brevundimonas sp.]|nr:nucleoside-diphosphate sugar epimerase [Citromicrobium sp.]MAO96940.1 nucleoside-diphosphate sugar epimerase [Citromicrobium sp.]MBD76784.1 nucleoside-diphosphate sugar epimerase [Citromicrobium sp.]HAV49305.1 nucleoside-diphosphate sugar epimerase [Brevundimonas sp.]